MKQRLIDANNLYADYIVASTTTNTLCHRYISKEQVENAPTVDAIPIEFIKQLIEKLDCERGNAIKDTYAHILSALLEFWEFEQEKENEAD